MGYIKTVIGGQNDEYGSCKSLKLHKSNRITQFSLDKTMASSKTLT